MPSSLTCPGDADLLAVAAGEEPSEELQKHLEECRSCSVRLDRFRSEFELFRQKGSFVKRVGATGFEPVSARHFPPSLHSPLVHFARVGPTTPKQVGSGMPM